MQKCVSVAAVVFSVFALAMAAQTYYQADARAEAALQRREKALVAKYKPEVEKRCREFGLKDMPQDPDTLDELFRPLGRLLAGLSK